MAQDLLCPSVMQITMNPVPAFSARILDNLSSAVIVFDAELRVCYMNQMAEMLLALSATHVIGESPMSWMSCHGSTLVDIINAASVGSPIIKRGVVLTTERSEITVDCTVTPFVDENDTAMTILELQQIDSRLRISREERLLTQQALTRDVVRGLAHEIKNPLGGLRGAAQLLESEVVSNELKEYTRIIIQEADRLKELVNRMLGPNRRPSYRPLNLHVVLERVRALVMAETGERINIWRDYDPSIPEMYGDPDQLIQSVLNIVRNAARVLDGNGEITIRTRIERQLTIGQIRHRHGARIEIIDNGPGIPPEIADTLFLPMVTGGTGGMGLGLSIAQSLINQHQGLIECDSHPGETVFTILLPVGETREAAVNKEKG